MKKTILLALVLLLFIASTTARTSRRSFRKPQYLLLDGSNANQDINIGQYGLTSFDIQVTEGVLTPMVSAIGGPGNDINAVGYFQFWDGIMGYQGNPLQITGDVNIWRNVEIQGNLMVAGCICYNGGCLGECI